LKISVTQKTATARKRFAGGRFHAMRQIRPATRPRAGKVTYGIAISRKPRSTNETGLLTEARLYRNAFASLGTAARNHGAARFGLHTSAEPVYFGTFAPVRLECTLRHVELAAPDPISGLG
jgi:hypothetical protein